MDRIAIQCPYPTAMVAYNSSQPVVLCPPRAYVQPMRVAGYRLASSSLVTRPCPRTNVATGSGKFRKISWSSSIIHSLQSGISDYQ